MFITPAILTQSKKTFDIKLQNYIKVFSAIDIDYCRKPFTQHNSISLISILNSIKVYSQYHKNVSFGIHLMTKNIISCIKKILNNVNTSSKLRVYLHQECNQEEIYITTNLLKTKKIHTGIVICVESKLKSAEFYNLFDEVQIMTVQIGKQGGKLNIQSLDKSKELRKYGYRGIISIDGGVNESVINLIKKYPIDRVSVGSYFQKVRDINDLKIRKNILLAAFNN
ncbi:MAG: hypothetical protein NZZ41_03675 [Candidatus Dojkabacteria bacterium]|nr:hypothetical protein [Candidatus Dojkabacteria bacterium]